MKDAFATFWHGVNAALVQDGKPAIDETAARALWEQTKQYIALKLYEPLNQ